MTSEERSATNRSATNQSSENPVTDDPAIEDPVTRDPAAGHPGDHLSALLDRELDPTTAADVNRHVDGCTACLAELTSLERVRRTVRDLPPVAAPPGFITQLIETRERANRRGVALVGVAACLVVVVGLMAAEPQAGSTGSTGSARGDVTRAGDGDELVRLEAHRASNGGDDLHPSMLDRAGTAASDLLEFLSG